MREIFGGSGWMFVMMSDRRYRLVEWSCAKGPSQVGIHPQLHQDSSTSLLVTVLPCKHKPLQCMVALIPVEQIEPIEAETPPSNAKLIPATGTARSSHKKQCCHSCGIVRQVAEGFPPAHVVLLSHVPGEGIVTRYLNLKNFRKQRAGLRKQDAAFAGELSQGHCQITTDKDSVSQGPDVLRCQKARWRMCICMCVCVCVCACACACACEGVRICVDARKQAGHGATGHFWPLLLEKSPPARANHRATPILVAMIPHLAYCCLGYCFQLSVV